jgi:hypothetical protein
MLVDSFGGWRAREEEKKLEAFWRNHTLLQLTHRILELKGESEVLVLTYFYERASVLSFRSNSPVEILLKNVTEKRLCNRTGLGPKSVYRAITTLEDGEFIKVQRTWCALTGERKVNVYLLLHSSTKEPLRCSEHEWQVCSENKDLPYLTAPWETRKKLIPMGRSGRQVYLTALSLASNKTSMSFAISKDEWVAESRLCRTAFNRGLKECKDNGLLSFKKYELTLHDPQTGKPSVRQKKDFLQHEDTNWKYNLDDLTAEHWRVVLRELLPRLSFNEGADGWTYTSRDVPCPFCHEENCFRVNFRERIVKGEKKAPSFECKKCDRFGFLGQLVKSVKGYPSMRKVLKFIKRVLGQWPMMAAA